MSSGTYPKNYPKMTIISNNRRYTALNWKMINLAEMARYTTSRNNLKSGSGFLTFLKSHLRDKAVKQILELSDGTPSTEIVIYRLPCRKVMR